MFVRIFLVTVCAALNAGLVVFAAHAQSAPLPTTNVAQNARAQLDLAERAYREQRYADAATAFLAADRLQPTPAVQLALGKTYEQLNDPSRALAAYREYFVRSPRAPDRAQVQGHVAELAARLAEQGVQQISVSSVPAGATVVVDAKPLGTTPVYIDLPPGPHHLEFHLTHYEPAALEFELSPQQPLNVTTTLIAARPGAGNAPDPLSAATAKPAPVPAPATSPQVVAAGVATTAATTPPTPGASVPAHATHSQPVDETTRLMRTLGFVAVGASVAALGTAVAFELLRSQSESRARQTEEQVAFEEALQTMETQQTIARVFAISAGVLAVTGGVLLILSAERAESPPSEGGVALACLPTGCNAVYRGQF